MFKVQPLRGAGPCSGQSVRPKLPLADSTEGTVWGRLNANEAPNVSVPRPQATGTPVTVVLEVQRSRAKFFSHDNPVF
mgnify:CR=1 FL=1